MRERGLSFAEALEVVAASGIFTTHTPVPAGIDIFPIDKVDRYLDAMRQQLGLTREGLHDLGRVTPGRADEPFSMAVLAIRTAGVINGVSRLHARVSRAMWQGLWPGVPADEIPIAHVTNGVHPQSWISGDMRSLYDRYLGPRWTEEPGDTRVWSRSEQIPGEELWRTHERRRERLVAFARARLVEQLRARGAAASEIAHAEEVLDPEALTIGFARRFATYKRGTLLLRDPQRLERLLNAPGRPVQILFAGKAHPRDDPGKQLVREIVQAARQPAFRNRIVFLEDYDQVVARYLVQGVDVWLNTPRRPLEASGTSGMKAAFNGALNLSVLDGWWDEAYSLRSGWAIGKGEEYGDHEYQDRVEAGALYDLLENEVVPLFYRRGADHLPRGWIALMRSTVSELCPVFNTNRMVFQYVVDGYEVARHRRQRLEEDDERRARALAAWKASVRQAWRQVRINRVEVVLPTPFKVGGGCEVRAWVHPGPLTAADLMVQVWVGKVNEARDIVQPRAVTMTAQPAGAAPDELLFTARVPCQTSGTHGLTVRALPRHEDLGHLHETGLITWA
jgi:starch phosphorylase